MKSNVANIVHRPRADSTVRRMSQSMSPVGRAGSVSTPASTARRSRPRSGSVSAIRRPSALMSQSMMPRGEGDCRAQVAVRVRPLNSKDPPDDPGIVTIRPEDGLVIVEESDGRRAKEFPFDHILGYSQPEVYEKIGQPLLADSYLGFNTCLFAYGQTGSGKTYSMQRSRGCDGSGDCGSRRREMSGSHGEGIAIGEDEGIIPRLMRDLFKEAQERVEAAAEEGTQLTVKISMSYLEVYNEKVRDLLCKRRNGVEPDDLPIVEHARPVNGRKVEVKGLGIHTVLSASKVLSLLDLGNSQRQVAETGMNEASSRSHSIVQLHLHQISENPEQGVRELRSTMTLVDLAGSERQSKTHTTGQQFEEAKKINMSLLTLGRALNAFSEETGEKISLRDSKLTRLLSESFGGNSKLWMLATVGPAAYNVSETLATLEYATRAKNIKCRASINKQQRALEMAELKTQVDALNAALETERCKVSNLEAELARLRQENELLKAETRGQDDDTETQSHGEERRRSKGSKRAEEEALCKLHKFQKMLEPKMLDKALQRERNTAENLQRFLTSLQASSPTRLPASPSTFVDKKAAMSPLAGGAFAVAVRAQQPQQHHQHLSPFSHHGAHPMSPTPGIVSSSAFCAFEDEHMMILEDLRLFMAERFNRNKHSTTANPYERQPYRFQLFSGSVGVSLVDVLGPEEAQVNCPHTRNQSTKGFSRRSLPLAKALMQQASSGRIISLTTRNHLSDVNASPAAPSILVSMEPVSSSDDGNNRSDAVISWRVTVHSVSNLPIDIVKNGGCVCASVSFRFDNPPTTFSSAPSNCTEAAADSRSSQLSMQGITHAEDVIEFHSGTNTTCHEENGNLMEPFSHVFTLHAPSATSNILRYCCTQPVLSIQVHGLG